MSYKQEYRYKIEPMESYSVHRNCSGCGCKTRYCNTNNFRVNANGTKIDIWLIYQCEHCKHTFNLNIHSRINPSEIKPLIYDRYLQNDRELSREYGLDKSIFSRNGALIDEKNIEYELVLEDGRIEDSKIEDNYSADIGYKDNHIESFIFQEILQSGILIHINNPFHLRLRVDKIVADLMHISRTKVGKLVGADMITVKEDLQNHGWTIQINKIPMSDGKIGEYLI